MSLIRYKSVFKESEGKCDYCNKPLSSNYKDRKELYIHNYENGKIFGTEDDFIKHWGSKEYMDRLEVGLNCYKKLVNKNFEDFNWKGLGW